MPKTAAAIRVAQWRRDNPEKYASQIEAVKARRRKMLDILNRYKIWCRCRKCGFRKAAVALDFHHTDPSTKSFCLTDCAQRKWKTVKAEVRKCVVLCANCHRMVEAGIFGVACPSMGTALPAEKE